MYVSRPKKNILTISITFGKIRAHPKPPPSLSHFPCFRPAQPLPWLATIRPPAVALAIHWSHIFRYTPLSSDEHYSSINLEYSSHQNSYRSKKHCQRHNGPRILSPKLELSLKDETNADSTLSLPPLLGNHLSHLVHLPVILLAHHHLNENRYLPMHCSNNIYCRQNDHSSPAPIFHATPVPPPWWSPPSKWQPSTSNCPIGIISYYWVGIIISQSHISKVSNKVLVGTDTGIHRPDPRDTWVR